MGWALSLQRFVPGPPRDAPAVILSPRAPLTSLTMHSSTALQRTWRISHGREGAHGVPTGGRQLLDWACKLGAGQRIHPLRKTKSEAMSGEPGVQQGEHAGDRQNTDFWPDAQPRPHPWCQPGIFLDSSMDTSSASGGRMEVYLRGQGRGRARAPLWLAPHQWQTGRSGLHAAPSSSAPPNPNSRRPASLHQVELMDAGILHGKVMGTWSGRVGAGFDLPGADEEGGRRGGTLLARAAPCCPPVSNGSSPLPSLVWPKPACGECVPCNLRNHGQQLDGRR